MAMSPQLRYACWDCDYTTLFEGGAHDHAVTRHHFVSDAPKPQDREDGYWDR